MPSRPRSSRVLALGRLLAGWLVSYGPLARCRERVFRTHLHTGDDAHELARRRRLGGGLLDELQRLGRVVALVDHGLAAPVSDQLLLREVALIVDVRC